MKQTKRKKKTRPITRFLHFFLSAFFHYYYCFFLRKDEAEVLDLGVGGQVHVG